jgi:hypothetical protein
VLGEREVEALRADGEHRDREERDVREPRDPEALREHRGGDERDDHGGEEDRERGRVEELEASDGPAGGRDRGDGDEHGDRPEGGAGLARRRGEERRQERPERRHADDVPEQHGEERADGEHEDRPEQAERQLQAIEQAPHVEEGEGSLRTRGRDELRAGVEPVLEVDVGGVPEQDLVAVVERE